MSSAALTALTSTNSIAQAPSEEAVLDRVVGAALSATGAPGGVALLVGTDGAPAAVVNHGMSEDKVAALSLADVVGPVRRVTEGQVLRLSESAGHPADGGPLFHHQLVDAFLGVPLRRRGEVLGGLYLIRERGEGRFSAVDEQMALAVAEQGASAVAALRTEEAARRLIDSLPLTEARADDPGWGTPTAPGGSSAVLRRLLTAARRMLGMQLTFLSRIEGERQTFAAVDAAPDAPPLAEGSVIVARDGYCRLLLDGVIPAAVPDVPAHPLLGGMAITADLSVGAYCGAPVHLPDGTTYGTLSGLSDAAEQPPSTAQIEGLQAIAGLIGRRLRIEQREAEDWRQRREAFLARIAGAGSVILVQPIAELATRRVTGVEALSRFTDPSGTPLPPDSVFHQAHQLGLTLHLELDAARAALGRLEQLPADMHMSINFSPTTLLNPAAHDVLAAVPLPRVVVEITEHEQVGDYAALRRALAPLRRGGLRIAVDDTGTGYAGLRRLTQLAPEVIKLDLAFVRDIDIDPARRAAARAVAGYAEEVGAALVAEGIETPGEADVLRTLGVRLGQGYLLGRPQTLAALLATAPGKATS